MSLQIWLPMTKDLRNQGIADVEITNNGATLDSAGKLGGCYYFNRSASNYLRVSNPLTSSLNEISMVFWVKLPSNGSVNDQLVHIGNGSGWNNNRFTCFVRANNPFLVFVCGDGSSSTTYSCASSHLTLNQWTHIVCTYNNGTMRIYLNGVLNKEYITNIVPSFANTPYIGIGAGPNSTEPATAYLNDVRIYDHALSPMEVKQLSQALVLHYSLSGNNGTLANKNLLLNSDTVFNNNGARLSSKTVFNGLINNSSAPNGKYRSWKIVAENETNRGVYYQYSVLIGTLDNLTQNDTYTFSFWARCSKNKNLMVSSLVESQSIQKFDDGKTAYNSNSDIVVDNIWEKHSVVFKWTSITKMIICFYLRSLDEDVVFDIAAPKLEKGDKATPWCPNSSDALYTALGYDDGIEYDTSGYGHNGTKVGTLNYSTDSPRYLASTVFDGTQAIRLGRRLYDSVSQLTVTEWFKTNTRNSTTPNLFSLGENSFLRVRLNSDNTLWWYIKGQNDTYTAPSSLIDNKWHFFAITFNSGIVKMYLDGVLVKTKDISSAMSEIAFAGSDTTFWGLGGYSASSEKYAGHLSDFRVYSSCLTDSEIQKLYTVSASIDSNGNAYSAAYVEG